MAMVTSVRNLVPPPGGTLRGFVTTTFDPHSGFLAIDGVGTNDALQVQSANVLIVCPTPGSQKLNK
jgi:hypothetical protein